MPNDTEGKTSTQAVNNNARAQAVKTVLSDQQSFAMF
jgi:hypothetical protein